MLPVAWQDEDVAQEFLMSGLTSLENEISTPLQATEVSESLAPHPISVASVMVIKAIVRMDFMEER